MATRKLTARIDNWFISGGRVHGNIYGDIHGRFKDGEYITTSSCYLNQSEPPEQHDLIETKHSTYVLGTPSRWL